MLEPLAQGLAPARRYLGGHPAGNVLVSGF